MPAGFSVTQRIERPTAAVWAYLTDFEKARDWMTGIEAMTQTTEGPLEIGTRFTFRSRGKQRETRVTALDPGTRIALTSTQGGVTATYTYSLAPDSDGSSSPSMRFAKPRATGSCCIR